MCADGFVHPKHVFYEVEVDLTRLVSYIIKRWVDLLCLISIRLASKSEGFEMGPPARETRDIL